jgi:hypothetical protein
MSKSHAPNWQDAVKFVERLTGLTDPFVTFQVFDDKGKDWTLAGWKHGRLSDNNVKRWLVSKAKAGCGIFVTINECDGNGRKAGNVLHARASFADLDGAPLPTNPKVRFDMVVSSSPGKYHVYNLIQQTDDLNAWSDCQARLAAAFDGDKKVHDPSRVLRLPGFWHQKGEPYRVRIVSMTDPFECERCELSDLAAAYDGVEYVQPHERKHGGRSDEPADGWKDDDPATLALAASYLAGKKITTGDRNNVAYIVAAELNDYAISPAKSRELMDEWNAKQADPLPNHEIAHVNRSAPTHKQGSAGAKALEDPQDSFPDEPDDDSWLEGKSESKELVRVDGAFAINKANRAADTIANAYAAVVKSGLLPAWDELQQNTVFLTPNLPWDERFGRVLTDHVMRITRMYFVNRWQGIDYQPGVDNLHEAIATIAYGASFNPILDYLDGLKWDGVSRIGKLFPTYFNTDDDDYSRGVSLAFMVGAVRRMRTPGCKFDTMPVLKSPQGWFKSTAVKKLFGDEWHSDADLGNLRDKDAAMKLRGIWVKEFAEIESFGRVEIGVMKTFCSSQLDRQRDPYGRVVENQKRRCIFVGTVNEGGYLKDSTGGRRFWPLDVRKPIDVDKIIADRDQLWAEASALEAQGVSVTLPEELWTLAGERQSDQTSADPWADTIRAFIDKRQAHHDLGSDTEADAEDVEPVRPPDRVHTSELFDALGIKTADQTKDKAQRLRTVMEAVLGWHHARGVRVLERSCAGYTREQLAVKPPRVVHLNLR